MDINDLVTNNDVMEQLIILFVIAAILALVGAAFGVDSREHSV
jgi:hypothetical protein